MNASVPDPQETPPPRDVLAGEYVLGVLDAQERRAAEARIDSDSEFAEAVLQWQQHLMPLADEIAPAEVPERVWVRIRASLGLDAPAPRAPAAPGFWDSVRTWRWLSAGGFATATACLLALLLARAPVPPPAAQPPPVATTTPKPSGIAMTSTLMQDDGKPGYVALMDADKRSITLTPLGGTHDSARVPELWLIPADGKARSMGVFDEAKARVARIPDALMPMLSDGAVLAVTMEPPGGAPGGVATGPVVAKGGISTLQLAP